MGLVFVSPAPDDDEVFQALRYKNDGELCVVTGPITKPRQVDNERITLLRLPSDWSRIDQRKSPKW